MNNILVLTYWSYNEALIQTYTLPYVRIIKDKLPPNSKIYLVTLEQNHLKLSNQEKNKLSQVLKDQNIIWIPVNYQKPGIMGAISWFFLLIKLWWICGRDDIKKIHAFCTPAGSVGYLLSLITRLPLIIDSMEPHAESMVENGTWGKNSMAYQALWAFEKWQSKRAQHLICAASGMESYIKTKYKLIPKSVFVKPSCVDLEQFNIVKKKNKKLLNELGLENKIVCVYAGKIGGIYLEQEIFDFFKTASEYWGDQFHVLMLSNASDEAINQYSKNAMLNPNIITKQFVAHKDIADYIGLGDFALNPVKPVPSKRYCTSIKDGEYWAIGLPVVITPNISDDSEIIAQNNIGAVLKGFDKQSYLKAIVQIDQLLKTNQDGTLTNQIVEIAKKHRSFGIADKVYDKIYLNTRK